MSLVIYDYIGFSLHVILKYCTVLNMQEGYLFTSIEVYTNLDATEIELTTLYIYLFIRCIPINLL